MTEFVPIHLSAFERSTTLMAWITSFAGNKIEFLKPMDWYTRGHDLDEGNWEVNIDGMKLPTLKTGTFIWSPPTLCWCSSCRRVAQSTTQASKVSASICNPSFDATYLEKTIAQGS